MPDPSVSLVVRVAPSAADARRGVVRLHPEVLDALGLRSWDAVRLTGARETTALAAPAAPGVAPGQATVDDVILSNAGLTEGTAVVVAPAQVTAARRVLLTGSRLARSALTQETARLALVGKIVTGGDAVSLLPQDVEPAAGLDVAAARRRLAGAVGGGWTTELLTVAGTEPAGAVAVVPSTVVGWQGDGAWGLQHGGRAAAVDTRSGTGAAGTGPRRMVRRPAGRRPAAHCSRVALLQSHRSMATLLQTPLQTLRRPGARPCRRRPTAPRSPSPRSTSTTSSVTPTPPGASSSGSS